MDCADEVGVAGVLSTLGVDPLPAPLDVTLPALPDLPSLPALPSLPTVDPTLLLKPITDLLGVFGTGTLGSAAGGDPAVLHQQIAQVLDGGVTTLLTAVRSLDGSWAGQAGTAAATAATRTASESGLLAAQGAGMSVDLQAAAGIVAAGALQLQGVVVKTAGLLAAALPAIATPPGLVAALGIAAEGLAEGLAVVSATRAQLVAPTASMTANGAPVSITGSPSGNGFTAAASLLESVLPLVQAGAQMATSLLSGTGLTTGDDTGTTPTGTAPNTAPTTTAPGTCAATCDKGASTTATSKAGALDAKGAGTSGTGASGTGTSGTGTSGAVATVGAVAPEPAPLADCPTTTNASTTAPASMSGTGPQMSTAATGSVMPMAPIAPATARVSADVARPLPVTPIASTPAEQIVEPDVLGALTAESLTFDVALALGLGDHDLAGSA